MAMKRVSQLAEHVTKSAQPNLAAVEAEVVEVDEGQASMRTRRESRR